jgi:hypothetical protein
MITSENVFSKGEAFPPKDETNRLKQYAVNTKLFLGLHEEVYLEDTKKIRPELAPLGRFIFNFQMRLSLLWVSLMLGETPSFSFGKPDSSEQKYLTKWMQREKFVSLLQMHRIDVSRYGDALLKLRVEKGKVICDVQAPHAWFPVVEEGNITRIKAHVLVWKVMQDKKYYLRLETHRAGEIENRAFLLGNADAATLQNEVPIELLEEGKQKLEKTGADVPLVFRVSNLLTSTSPYGYDDYQDIDSMIFEIEDRMVQISKILDKHADPTMYGPESALERGRDGGWGFRQAGYLPLDSKEDAVPGYVTWNGDIKSAIEQINKLERQLFMVSETSEAAFGQLTSGIAESGSALKRLLISPLGKTARVRMAYDDMLPEFFRAVLTLAKKFEKADVNPDASYAAEWRDGLPNDETEDATYVSSLRPGEKSLSSYAAIKKLHPDWDEAKIQEEVERIETDAARASAISPGGGADLFNNPRIDEADAQD